MDYNTITYDDILEDNKFRRANYMLEEYNASYIYEYFVADKELHNFSQIVIYFDKLDSINVIISCYYNQYSYITRCFTYNNFIKEYDYEDEYNNMQDDNEYELYFGLINPLINYVDHIMMQISSIYAPITNSEERITKPIKRILDDDDYNEILNDKKKYKYNFNEII